MSVRWTAARKRKFQETMMRKKNTAKKEEAVNCLPRNPRQPTAEPAATVEVNNHKRNSQLKESILGLIESQGLEMKKEIICDLIQGM